MDTINFLDDEMAYLDMFCNYLLQELPNDTYLTTQLKVFLDGRTIAKGSKKYDEILKLHHHQLDSKNETIKQENLSDDLPTKKGYVKPTKTDDITIANQPPLCKGANTKEVSDNKATFGRGLNSINLPTKLKVKSNDFLDKNIKEQKVSNHQTHLDDLAKKLIREHKENGYQVTGGKMFIRKSIIYDNRLKGRGIILFSHIERLAHHKGYCTATNKQLAKLLKIDDKTVSRHISRFEKYHLIKRHIVYKGDTKEMLERRLYITAPLEKDNL